MDRNQSTLTNLGKELLADEAAREQLQMEHNEHCNARHVCGLEQGLLSVLRQI